MKSMPGMGDIQSMLARMGMGHMMPGGSKINVDAMQSSLNSKIKTSKERDRLLCVLEQRNAQKSAALSQKETAISANAIIPGGDNKETQDLPQQSKKKKKHVKRL